MKDIQQIEAIGECENCHGEIYKGKHFYEYDGASFCAEDCVLDFVMEGIKFDMKERVA